jgi:hypothetical protein
MKNTKYAVMITLLKIMVRHNKYWSVASQKKLLTLLQRFHHLKIERRQLNYHLADLRRLGYIKTIQRKHRRDDGTLCLLTSAHCITLAGYRYLLSKAVKEAWYRIKELTRRYLPPPRTKEDQDKTLETRELPPKRTGKNPFLDPTFRKRKGMKPLPDFS